jgi:hypothetical protein
MKVAAEGSDRDSAGDGVEVGAIVCFYIPQKVEDCKHYRPLSAKLVSYLLFVLQLLYG